MRRMRQKRKYGLFVKRGRRWLRLFPDQAYLLESARRHFQTSLINLSMEGDTPELRPVKDAKPGWYERLGA